MDSDWLETRLAPTLSQLADREWTGDALRVFVNDLSQLISSAVRTGELSRDGARVARERVAAAMSTVPRAPAATALDELDRPTAAPGPEQGDD